MVYLIDVVSSNLTGLDSSGSFFIVESVMNVEERKFRCEAIFSRLGFPRCKILAPFTLYTAPTAPDFVFEEMNSSQSASVY